MHRARLDQNDALLKFCQVLESSVINAVESGYMTKDLALIIHGENMTRSHWLNTIEVSISKEFKIHE